MIRYLFALSLILQLPLYVLAQQDTPPVVLESVDPGPQINASKDGQRFLVTFAPGAVWAITHYRMVEATEEKSATWPDGHYAPKHVWAINPDMPGYVDNWAFIDQQRTEWDVWAEIGYPNPSWKQGDPEEDHLTYIKTNVLRVRW